MLQKPLTFIVSEVWYTIIMEKYQHTGTMKKAYGEIYFVNSEGGLCKSNLLFRRIWEKLDRPKTINQLLDEFSMKPKQSSFTSYQEISDCVEWLESSSLVEKVA